jgi:uncharacterized membrane protein YccC
MNSSNPYLPPETILNFITSVRKALENHPDPKSDANLKEMERLARELEADAFRHQRAQQAEARRAATDQRRKLDADQRREDARVASREPGDLSSRPLI